MRFALSKLWVRMPQHREKAMFRGQDVLTPGQHGDKHLNKNFKKKTRVTEVGHYFFSDPSDSPRSIRAVHHISPSPPFPGGLISLSRPHTYPLPTSHCLSLALERRKCFHTCLLSPTGTVSTMWRSTYFCLPFFRCCVETLYYPLFSHT